MGAENGFILKRYRKCRSCPPRGAWWLLARTPPVSRVDSRSSSSLFKLLSPPHKRHFEGGVRSLALRPHTPHLSRRVPGGYFFSVGAFQTETRAQTELCFRLLQWADKAEEGTRAWLLRRVGWKRRNSPFSGKNCSKCHFWITHSPSDNGLRDVTFGPAASGRRLNSGVWKWQHRGGNGSWRPIEPDSSYISHFTATCYTLYNHYVRASHTLETSLVCLCCKYFWFVYITCVSAAGTPRSDRNPVVSFRRTL